MNCRLHNALLLWNKCIISVVRKILFIGNNDDYKFKTTFFFCILTQQQFNPKTRAPIMLHESVSLFIKDKIFKTIKNNLFVTPDEHC